MRYIEAVSLARKKATMYGVPYIVFGIKERWHFRESYYCGDVECFQFYLTHTERPVVRYMMCMPNGVVVQ